MPDAAYGAFQRGLYITAYNLRSAARRKTAIRRRRRWLPKSCRAGLGLPRDEPEAAKWYAAAAEQGVPEAQFQYALLLLDGRVRDEGPERRLRADAGGRRGRQSPGAVQFRADAGRPRAGAEGPCGSRLLLRARRRSRACRRAICDVAVLRQRRRRQEARRRRGAALAVPRGAAELRHGATRSRHLADRGHAAACANTRTASAG